MKRSYEDTSASVDMSVHSNVCLKYFQCVLVPTASVGAFGVKEAVSAIYEDASVMIKTLLQSNSFAACETTPETSQSQAAASATMLVRDLILMTSFVCTNAHQFQMQQKSTSSATVVARRNTASPISALIAIAPYWAIAALLSQSKTDPNASQKVKAALKVLLTSKMTARAHLEISDEIAQCAAHLPTHWTKDPVTNLILSRLRRALRTHLKNILLFAVILSVSMHTELSNNLHKASLGLPQVAIDHLLSASDDNCIDVVRIVVNCAPQLALATDTGSVGATPLAYAASYRSRPGVDAECLDYKLALGLCKVLTEIAASSLAISDRLGMLPLHHAARKGHSVVVDFLSSHFEFTVPLRDASGKAALHHALISWRQLSEESILHLAAMNPRVLREYSSPSAFDPLEYARRHCSETVVKGFEEIFTAAFSSSSSPASSTASEERPRCDLKKYQISPSGNASTSTDPELSESDNEEDAHHENDSISSVEEDRDEAEVPSLMEVKSTSTMNFKDQDLLQYADTLLMLQSATSVNLDDETAEPSRSNKRQKVF